MALWLKVLRRGEEPYYWNLCANTVFAKADVPENVVRHCRWTAIQDTGPGEKFYYHNVVTDCVTWSQPRHEDPNTFPDAAAESQLDGWRFATFHRGCFVPAAAGLEQPLFEPAAPKTLGSPADAWVLCDGGCVQRDVGAELPEDLGPALYRHHRPGRGCGGGKKPGQ